MSGDAKEVVRLALTLVKMGDLDTEEWLVERYAERVAEVDQLRLQVDKLRLEKASVLQYAAECGADIARDIHRALRGQL